MDLKETLLLVQGVLIQVTILTGLKVKTQVLLMSVKFQYYLPVLKQFFYISLYILK